MWVLLVISIVHGQPPAMMTQEFSSYYTCEDAGYFLWRTNKLDNSEDVTLLYQCDKK